MYDVWGARDDFDFERENDTVGGGGGRGIPVESVLIVVVTSLCLSLFSLSTTALSVLAPSVQTGRIWTLNVFFSAPTRRCRRRIIKTTHSPCLLWLPLSLLSPCLLLSVCLLSSSVIFSLMWLSFWLKAY